MKIINKIHSINVLLRFQSFPGKTTHGLTVSHQNKLREILDKKQHRKIKRKIKYKNQIRKYISLPLANRLID